MASQIVRDLLRAIKNDPHATAVDEVGGRTLTYLEFGQLVDRVGRQIETVITADHPRVAIDTGSGAIQAATLIALLGMGASVVPIDSGMSDEQIDRILSDTGCSLVLTGPKQTRGYSGVESCPIKEQDTGNQSYRSSYDRIHKDVMEATIIICSSGTMGRPKPIMIPESAIYQYTNWWRQEYAINSKDRVLALASFGIDIGIWEIVLPLVSGATLVYPDIDLQQSPEDFWHFLHDQDITVAHITTSLAELTLLFETERLPSTTRLLVASSEAATYSLLGKVDQRLPDSATLVYLYGVTEASVESTAYVYEGEHSEDAAPIGHAIDGNHVYVLDEALEMVQPEQHGELYVGGNRLAAGYLGRPGLTAQKYIPDPWVGNGSRMFRTGDGAFFDPEGRLFVTGRRDREVKWRGRRIDLSDLEQVIVRVPGVSYAIVEVDADNGALDAYLSIERTDVDRAALLELIADTLPESARPSRYYEMSEQLLTSNGKRDRAALKVNAHRIEFGTRELSATSSQKTVTSTERIACEAFAEALKLARISPESDFFSVGGHSVNAVHALGLIAERTGVQLRSTAIHAHRTARRIADVIDEMSASSDFALDYRTQARSATLTSAQLAIWFAEKSFPADMTPYNNTMLVDIRHEIEEQQIKDAIQNIVGVFPALRTRYLEYKGEPSQVVDTVGSFNQRGVVEFVSEEDSSWIYNVILGETLKPFDLETDWPIRVSVLPRGSEGSRLLVVLHHIAADAVAMVRVREALESALVGELQEEPQPYLDAVRRASSLDVPGMPNSMHENGLDALQPLRLPYDRRDIQDIGRAGQLNADLQDAACAQLLDFARQNALTPFTVMLAATQAYLSELCTTNTPVVGVVVDRRAVVDTDIVGSFSETALHWVDFTRGMPVSQYLSSVANSLVQCTANANLGLLNVSRSVANAPGLTKVVVSWENDNLKTGTRPYDGPVIADLHFMWSHGPDGEVSVEVRFDRNKFAHATADSIVRGVISVCDRITRGYASRDWFSVLEQETARRSTRANPGADLGGSVISMLREVVLRVPSSVALEEGHTALTYVDVWDRAECFAGGLRARGIQRGDVVGTWMRRSVDHLVAMIGTMMNGSVYLPLKGESWDRSKESVWNRASPKLLVTDELYSGPASIAGIRPTCLYSELSSREALLSRPVRASDGAYLMFTSGSTGEPKGVLVDHSSLAQTISDVVSRLELHSSDIHLHKTIEHFDVSMGEIWGSLLSAGTLVICPDGLERDPQRLIELMQDSGATVVHATPTLLSLLQLSSSEFPRSVRLIVSSGESLPEDLAMRVLRSNDSIELWNFYGPTETTIWVCGRKWRAPFGNEIAHIGDPFTTSQLYVLDDEFRRAQPLIPGEIYIGGKAVSSGYYDLPAATSAKFLPDPFSPERGARMYRTGDLGYYDAAGHLRFVGRSDNQIKVRGTRIECAGVEAALLRHRAVIEAHVVGHGGGVNPEILVGFLVGDKTDDTEFRRYLEGELRGDHIPDRLVWVEALPSTPSGKVDVPQLVLAMEAESAVASAAPTPPMKSEVENIVMAAWKHELGSVKIEGRDNYFFLGGTSVSAARLVAKLCQDLEADLRLADLFEAPRFDSYLDRVREQVHTASASSTVDRPRGDQERYPASMEQWFVWMASLTNVHSAYEVEQTWLINAGLTAEALREILVNVFARRDVFCTTYEYDGEALSGRLSSKLHMECLVVEEPNDDCTLAAYEANARLDGISLDISRGPIAGAVFVQSGKHVICAWKAHHLSVDGSSLTILQRDLDSAVRKAQSGEKLNPLCLGAAAPRYADYAVLQYPSGSSQLEPSHGASEMSNVATGIDLEIGWLRETELQDSSPSSVSSEATLGDGEFQRLRERAESWGCSIYPVLMGVFGAASKALTGQRELVFGADISTRYRANDDDLVGLFATEVPIGLAIVDDLSIASYLDACTASLTSSLRSADRLIEMNRERRRSPQRRCYSSKLTYSDLPHLGGITRVRQMESEYRRSDCKIPLEVEVFSRLDKVQIQARGMSNIVPGYVCTWFAHAMRDGLSYLADNGVCSVDDLVRYIRDNERGKMRTGRRQWREGSYGSQ